jgi:hypothetical protein
MINVNDYLNAEDDAASQDLFASQYTSRELAYVLADEISLRSDNADRAAFLADYNAGPMLGWIRGSLTRALSAKGVTVQVINRRKS